MVRDVNPVIAAIGGASQEQAMAASEVSRSADATARFVETVLHRFDDIDRVALAAASESLSARQALSEGSRQADSMLRPVHPDPAPRRLRPTAGDMTVFRPSTARIHRRGHGYRQPDDRHRIGRCADRQFGWLNRPPSVRREHDPDRRTPAAGGPDRRDQRSRAPRRLQPASVPAMAG